MNNIICKNCSAENPFYELICRNCKAYIRERIVNLDLWKMIAAIIETPIKAFSDIIHAEHKNFIFFILFMAAVKMLVNVMLLAPVTSKTDNPFSHFIRNFFIILGVMLVLFCFFSLAVKLILKTGKLDTRFKDNYAILTYSLVPHMFGAAILFPIEMVIFGGFLFSNNPSPFILKESVAYILLGFEALLILWQIFLTTTGFYMQTGKIALALLLSLIFNTLLYYILYLFSYLIV
jgi:hypothetical protein